MTYTLHGESITLPTTGTFFEEIIHDMFDKKYPHSSNKKVLATRDIAFSILSKYPNAQFTIGIANSAAGKSLFANAYIKVTAYCNQKGDYYRIYFMI